MIYYSNMLSLREITKELFAEKTRIILTILAIAWGTFAIASMLAIGEGLRINFAKTMANAGNNLLTITGGHTTKSYRGMHGDETIKLFKSDLQIISTLPNVVSISPQYNFSTRIHYKDKTIRANIQAVSPEYARIHRINVGAHDKFISTADMKLHNSVIVLGNMTAESLFPNDPNIEAGERTVFIGSWPFKIIGIMQKKSEMVAGASPDASFNWIPSTTFELFANPNTISSIIVEYRDVNLVKQTKKNIQQLIALNHGADPNDESVVNFTDLSENQKDVNNFFVGMQIFLGIIGALTLLIAGVGISNVMFASVKRATHEIGIRLAIGATTRQIIAHYILESMVATAIGGAIGILLSMLLVYGMSLIPMQGKLIDAIGKPKPILSFMVLVVVILILGIVGLLAGLFPALKAANIDPAEALIYE